MVLAHSQRRSMFQMYLFNDFGRKGSLGRGGDDTAKLRHTDFKKVMERDVYSAACRAIAKASDGGCRLQHNFNVIKVVC
jgi:hypothetical protein